MGKQLKVFDATRGGVLMDATFKDHARDCAQCVQFKADEPATAALMCLEGSVLYLASLWSAATTTPARRR